MKTTRSQLQKIASVPCLYRHEANHSYYGLKKQHGRKVSKALKDSAGEAITNFQEAKAALATWLASLTQVAEEASPFTPAVTYGLPYPRPINVYQHGINSAARSVMDGTAPPHQKARYNRWLALEEAAETAKQEQQKKTEEENQQNPTLSDCFAQFKLFKAHNSKSTLEKYDYMKRVLDLYKGQTLLDTPITEITAENIVAFFANFPTTKKPRYFNTFSLVLNQVFEMAVIKKYIETNPFTFLPKNVIRRKVPTVPDEVPTIEQCEAIVANIRCQKASDTREDSANLCEFIHLAALGQAEAGFLTWKDIDFEKGLIRAKRIKTGKFFDVPIYPHLKPFLEALAASNPNRKPTDKLFKIQSMQKALYAACARLKLPLYSPRDLRKARIVWMLRKAVPVELIAKWQGHSDNGVLIRKTYAFVIDDAAASYQNEQLKKLL
jgi:integrase